MNNNGGKPLTWIALNARLRELTVEPDVLRLFRRERMRGARAVCLRRIWGRYAALRAAREQKLLVDTPERIL